MTSIDLTPFDFPCGVTPLVGIHPSLIGIHPSRAVLPYARYSSLKRTRPTRRSHHVVAIAMSRRRHMELT